MAGVGLLVVVPLLGGSPSGSAAAPDRRSWSAVETVQADTGLETYGPVVQLSDGSTVALWTNNRHRHLFMAERPAHGSWTPRTDLSGPRSEVWNRTVVEAPHSKFTVAWTGTVRGTRGIWTCSFRHGQCAEPRLEVRPTAQYSGLKLATARGVVALEWTNDGPIAAVAVRHGAGDMTILPPLPTSSQYVSHLAVNRAGHPTVVGRADGRILVTTYGSNGAWVEEVIEPSPGYQLAGPSGYVTAVSNRAGDLALGWREIPGGGGYVGATRVHVRPNGGALSPLYTLTKEADCREWLDPCVTLGMDAHGDVTAVYATNAGAANDIWFTRRDAATGMWTSATLLLEDGSRYFRGAHATALSGGSVIAIPLDGNRFLVYRCGPAGTCGPPATLGPPNGYHVAADSARRSAALLWGAGCAGEECEIQDDLLARVYE